MTMRTPRNRDGEYPPLEEVAPHIESRMHGKTGEVLLRYHEGTLKKVKFGDEEDTRAMPRRSA